MKRYDTKQEIRPARTTFVLTRDEVIEALAAYAASQGEEVPDGIRNIWFHEPCGDRFATLVVDHDDVAQTEAKP